jgi:hypothetical protein
MFNANLFLVTICTPNSLKPPRKLIMKKIHKRLWNQNYTAHIYNDVNIENGIINFTNSINADLIGLCTHGRTGLAHFNWSISEDPLTIPLNPHFQNLVRSM